MHSGSPPVGQLTLKNSWNWGPSSFVCAGLNIMVAFYILDAMAMTPQSKILVSKHWDLGTLRRMKEKNKFTNCKTKIYSNKQNRSEEHHHLSETLRQHRPWEHQECTRSSWFFSLAIHSSIILIWKNQKPPRGQWRCLSWESDCYVSLRILVQSLAYM